MTLSGTGETERLEEDQVRRGVALEMEHVDGRWLVAGLGPSGDEGLEASRIG